MLYIEDEIKGWELFSGMFGSACTGLKGADITDRVDGWLTGRTGVKAVFEIKVRDMPSNKYPDWFLETKKAEELLRVKEEGDCDKALYINFFSDGVCVIWEVTPELFKRAQTMRLTHFTRGRYGEEYIDKGIIRLRTDEAVWVSGK